MGGVGIYKKIKEVRPDAVLVMMTASAVEDLVQGALVEGVHGIVCRSVDIQRVVALVIESQSSSRGAVVLVADHDPGTRVILKDVLVKTGYRVVTAPSSKEAIVLASDRACDILLIDLRLPPMNSLETYLAIEDLNLEAVAVMMTAHRLAMANLVEQAPGNPCLYKPLDMDELLSLIEGIW